MVKTPRYYQTEAIQSALDWWNNVSPRALWSMFVGTGKTAAFVWLVRELSNKRVLVLAHRQELIEQPRAVFVEEFGDERSIGLVGGVDGKMNTDYQSDIICSSIQSLIQKKDASKHLNAILSYGRIDYLIIDEVHHAGAKTYLKLVEILEEHNPDIKILGVTATPHRHDNISLGIVFPEVMDRNEFTYSYGYKQALDDGYCLPFKPFEIKTNIDLSGFKFRQGQVIKKDEQRLAELLKASNWPHLMWEALSDPEMGGPEMKTLGFMPGVDTSYAFTKFLGEEYGVEAGHVASSGSRESQGIYRWSNLKQAMVPIKRSELFDLFKKGEIHYLNNMMVATEGFDDPQIMRLLMGLPTQSVTMEVQMRGRGTRPPGPNGIARPGEFCTGLYVGYQGHKFVDYRSVEGVIPPEVKENAEKILGELDLEGRKPNQLLCDHCGNALSPAPDGLWCMACQLTFTPEGMDFDLINPNKPNGLGVHYEAIKEIATANVSWKRDGDMLATSLGDAGNGHLSSGFAEYPLSNKQKEFLSVHADRTLIILMVDNQYVLIGVYKRVKEVQVTRQYSNYSSRPVAYHKQEHIILKRGSLETVINSANLIANELKNPVLSHKKQPWRNKPASEAQIKALNNFDVNIGGLTKGDASDWLSIKFARSYLKRKKLLDN